YLHRCAVGYCWGDGGGGGGLRDRPQEGVDVLELGVGEHLGCVGRHRVRWVPHLLGERRPGQRVGSQSRARAGAFGVAVVAFIAADRDVQLPTVFHVTRSRGCRGSLGLRSLWLFPRSVSARNTTLYGATREAMHAESAGAFSSAVETRNNVAGKIHHLA